MPICNSPQATMNKKPNADISADHVTEAAKVKRTREQAYFNSYDFDAIEVLPYDESATEEEAEKHKQKKQQQQQQKVASSLSSSKNSSNAPTITTTTSESSSRSSSSGRYSESHGNVGVVGVAVGVGVGLTEGVKKQNSNNNNNNNNNNNTKYAYLQRLGAFFGGTLMNNAERNLPTASTAAIVLDDVVGYGGNELNDHATTTHNGNFLLPRAMLKYQSIGSGGSSSSSSNIGGNAISMPLADNSVNNAVGAPQQQQPQQQQLMQSNSHNSNSSSNGKMKLMTNNNNNIILSSSSSSNAAVAIVSGTALNAPSTNVSNKTRLVSNAKTNSNSHDNSQTGFLTDGGESTTVPALTVAAAATNAARLKKQSTSSSIATTASTNDSAVSIGSISNEEIASDKISMVTPATTAIAVAATSSVVAATTQQRHHQPPMAENVQHGRASSHQSHYSTDKSGSSGYYSSNVCSTYSLDEHIYCEPVIDIILDTNEKSKNIGKVRPQLYLPQKQQRQKQQKLQQQLQLQQQQKVKPTSKVAAAAASDSMKVNLPLSSQRLDMLGIGRRKRITTGIRINGNTADADGDADADDDDDDDDDDDEDGDGDGEVEADEAVIAAKVSSICDRIESKSTVLPHYSENLRILETSIENLDRHLKSFPNLCTQDRIVSYVQSTQPSLSLPLPLPLPPQLPIDISNEKLRPYNYLPTIMEGVFDGSAEKSRRRHSWQHEIATDDSLLDIDLDSFLLVNERKEEGSNGRSKNKRRHSHKNHIAGFVNPTFLTDEQVEENNYKCAKYINSCPEDAYCVESVNGEQVMSHETDHYLKRYEDQLHFQSTRELLEDVRDKIRLLSRSRNEMRDENPKATAATAAATTHSGDSEVPKELEEMIQTLKHELESYLQRMNQHSELEIRQLCSGLVKNQHVLKIQKAFERRQSSLRLDAVEYDFSAYEDIRDGGGAVPLSTIREQQVTTIRCASDPNFKMKRKSITEVFPIADYYVETDPVLVTAAATNGIESHRMQQKPRQIGAQPPLPPPPPPPPSATTATAAGMVTTTQMQRNLSFFNPVLKQFEANIGAGINGGGVSIGGGGIVNKKSTIMNARATSFHANNCNAIRDPRGGGGGGMGARDERDDIISDWHSKKPSYWEMYYGTNRMHQALLGKQQRIGELAISSSTQATMSYPSSRPESDFTLDLPRAEQLRLKMEKEKKFRQRCRYITTFLSLVFFLLTVMVVSLVLTRGKRMFGSMI